MVGLGLYRPIRENKRVILLAATLRRPGKAIAEFHPFYAGDGKKRRRQPVGHPIKPGIPQPAGQPQSHAFYHPAQGIPRRLGRQDLLLHPGDEFLAPYRQFFFGQSLQQLFGGPHRQRDIPYPAHRKQPSRHSNIFLLQQAQRQTARRAQQQGHPAAQRAAPAGDGSAL